MTDNEQAQAIERPRDTTGTKRLRLPVFPLREVVLFPGVTMPVGAGRPGTLRAIEPPIVVITSNRTREIHDAVKRRCFYHWVDYPDAARELEILRRKAPKASAGLSSEVVAFVQRLRSVELFKLPGVAETIDWANCLVALDRIALDPETVNNTLGVLLKYQDDIEKIAGEEATRLVAESKAAATA